MHIYTTLTQAAYTEEPDVEVFTDNILKLAQAYNARQSVTLNGITYDFTAILDKKVAYAIFGHSHFDMITEWKDIPIILTRNASYTPSFDLCYADYSNGKLKMVRFGNGTNRETNIIR
jgi:hypothetical protein